MNIESEKPIKGFEENTFRVLVIDDDVDDCRLVTVLLADAWPFEHDLTVDCAVDGHEALEKLRAQKFALIILDWKLPTISGGDVLRSIRKSGGRLPVVVLSGMRQEDIHEDLASLGAAFLNKDRMTAGSFYAAITTSLRLMGLLETPSKALA